LNQQIEKKMIRSSQQPVFKPASEQGVHFAVN